MKHISDWFYRFSSWKIALMGLLIFLVFSIFTLPGQSQFTEAYSHGTGSPDTSLFYKSSELTRMADAYGIEGRQAFIKARWSFDLVFPLVYTFFLTTAISWLLRNTGIKQSWRILNLVPLAAMIFDYLENIATSLVMWRFPIPCPLGLWLAPFFTPVKWLLVGASFVILISGIIFVLIVKIRKNPKSD